MFALRDTPLDAEALKDRLRHEGAGACATFEGWVRNSNEGKPVHRLDYEAYPALAEKEGQRILEEATRRFGLLHAQCEHRVGELAIGDMAVWVGVSAAHRGEAFAACRYIIDEVKHRVPIWKKEFYEDGDSGWVNCERCAAHAHTHGPAVTEGEYYDRQVRLSEIGPMGQAKLKASRVLIVGAGGLGSPAGLYLASAGIGTIGIVEGDLLEGSNLHRQTLFAAEDIGKPKALLAANRLRALNPHIDVRVHETRLSSANAEQIFNEYDLIFDCTDNFETKYLINDAAVLAKKPVIFASIYQFEGHLHVYAPGEGTPCMRCLWPEAPEAGCIGSCADVGVLGSVPGIAGAMQATEALKRILGLPGQLRNELLLCDFLSYSMRRLRHGRRADCPVCSGVSAVRIETFDEDPDAWELNPEALVNGSRETYRVIDVRETEDAMASPLPIDDAERAPLSRFDWENPPMGKEEACVLCCARGVRSRGLVRALRKQGYSKVYSLRGGAAALRAVRSMQL